MMYWRGSEWPVEYIRRINANEAHSRRIRDKRKEKSLDGTGGLWSLSGLEERPEWPVWDKRRHKAHRAHRRWLRAREVEEDRRRDAENTQRQINDGAEKLKLAPSQLTEPEVEARAWAVGYFQDNKHELTREGSKSYPIKEYVRYLAHSYEECRENPNKEGWKWKSVFIDPGFDYAYEQIEYCAFMIDRGEPLPERLREFVVGVLRENTDKLARGFKTRAELRGFTERGRRGGKRGPAAGDYERRDTLIKIAVRHIVERWKLEATRGQAAMYRGRKASAAAVVCKALADAKVWNCEEKSVNDIVDADTRWVRYTPILEGDLADRNLAKSALSSVNRSKAKASRSVRKVNKKPQG